MSQVQTQPGAAVVQIFHNTRAMNRGREEETITGRSAGATRAMRDSDTCAAPPGLVMIIQPTQGLRPGLPS